MRVTLLSTELLRTPACPGFGVSGDRKMSCFDRFGRQREVGRELWLWGYRRGVFERVQMGARLEDRGSCGCLLAGSFERVQTVMGRAIPGAAGAAGLKAGWFERVQMGAQLSERTTDSTATEGPFERVQLEGEPGRREMGGLPEAGLFERVQMTGVSANRRAAMPPLK
jgi:hypothetical protein